MDEDKALFFSEMADVTRHRKADRAERQTSAEIDPSVAARRDAAVREDFVDPNRLSGDYAPPLGPYDEISFARPGVQSGVLRKLRLGQYPSEATLDLHGRTVEQARVEVFDFIDQSRKYGLRTVRITHGKGERSERGYSLLKSFVALWLPQLDDVLACYTAQPKDGGRGAVYVLIKT